MHIVIRIGTFVIHVFILESDTMHIIILHIVENSEVIVNVASSVEVLWEEIESNIIPVRRLNLISSRSDMLVRDWDR